MTRTNRTIAAALAGTLLGTGVLLGAGAAQAKPPRTEVTKQCGSITTTLKVKPDDGRMEVEFELDQNRNGVRWSLQLRDNGAAIARAVRTTAAPSGSLHWRVLAADRAGSHRYTVVAQRGNTTCTITASR